MTGYHKRVLDTANTRMERLTDNEITLVNRLIDEGFQANPTDEELTTLDDVGKKLGVAKPDPSKGFWYMGSSAS